MSSSNFLFISSCYFFFSLSRFLLFVYLNVSFTIIFSILFFLPDMLCFFFSSLYLKTKIFLFLHCFFFFFFSTSFRLIFALVTFALVLIFPLLRAFCHFHFNLFYSFLTCSFLPFCIPASFLFIFGIAFLFLVHFILFSCRLFSIPFSLYFCLSFLI